MVFVLGAFTLFIVGAVILFVILWFRVDQVFAYRRKVGKLAKDLDLLAIQNRTFTIKGSYLLLLLNTPFEDMVYRFWKPLESFFPPELDVRERHK